MLAAAIKNRRKPEAEGHHAVAGGKTMLVRGFLTPSMPVSSRREESEAVVRKMPAADSERLRLRLPDDRLRRCPCDLLIVADAKPTFMNSASKR